MNIQDQLHLMRAEWQCVFEVLQQRADACAAESQDERARVDLLCGTHTEHERLIAVLIAQNEALNARVEKLEAKTANLTVGATTTTATVTGSLPKVL